MKGNLCCAEAYLDAEWSAGQEEGTQVRLASWTGDATVNITYNASSSLCGRNDTIGGRVVGGAPSEEFPQWLWLPAKRQAVCQ